MKTKSKFIQFCPVYGFGVSGFPRNFPPLPPPPSPIKKTKQQQPNMYWTEVSYEDLKMYHEQHTSEAARHLHFQQEIEQEIRHRTLILDRLTRVSDVAIDRMIASIADPIIVELATLMKNARADLVSLNHKYGSEIIAKVNAAVAVSDEEQQDKGEVDALPVDTNTVHSGTDSNDNLPRVVYASSASTSSLPYEPRAQRESKRRRLKLLDDHDVR